MNYFIVGPVSPPLGGISVYVDRLSRQLRTAGHNVTNIDFTRGGIAGKVLGLLKIVFDPRSTTVDLHAFDFSAMAAALVRPFGKTVTYMDHNTLLYRRQVAGPRAWILKRFLRRAKEVSFVSAEGMKFYKQNGFTFRSAVVKHAYIQPPLAEQSRIYSGYSSTTRSFIEKRRPLLVANASQVVFAEGKDLYGMDMCVDLVLALRVEFPMIGLLFGLANPARHPEYLRAIKKKIQDAGAAENFHFLTGQQELWPVFRCSVLMLRPTTGDGYAVSVAEALDLGCKVLASDAVERPEEAVLFRSRDMEDFIRKARSLLTEFGTEWTQ